MCPSCPLLSDIARTGGSPTGRRACPMPFRLLLGSELACPVAAGELSARDSPSLSRNMRGARPLRQRVRTHDSTGHTRQPSRYRMSPMALNDTSFPPARFESPHCLTAEFGDPSWPTPPTLRTPSSCSHAIRSIACHSSVHQALRRVIHHGCNKSNSRLKHAAAGLATPSP